MFGCCLAGGGCFGALRSALRPSVDRKAVPWPLLVVFLGRSSSSERARAADLLVLLEERARRAGDAVQRRVEEEGERPVDPRPAVPCSSSSGRALVIHSSSSPPSDPRTTVPCSSSWCSAAPVLGPCCSAARSRRHLLQICSTSAARLPGNLVPAEVLILESAAYVYSFCYKFIVTDGEGKACLDLHQAGFCSRHWILLREAQESSSHHREA
ncbi:hypothetical protein ZEAMMB73_Zm00001d038686 [Zea mays]|uniref:Uncharacterized protein n=2 Tax=Zea mays TaxID=4577 RepID=A0A1Q1BF42_MAIZE|nr:hypothetical protein ZEAMMB73_Zm00001d038686 [Zea mays]